MSNTFVQLTSTDLWSIRSSGVVYNQAPMLLQKLIQHSYHIVKNKLAEEYVGDVKDRPLLGKTTYWSEDDVPELSRQLASAGFSKEHFLDMLVEGHYTEYLDSTLIKYTILADEYKDQLFSVREITNITNFSTINPEADTNNKVMISYKQKTNLDHILINKSVIKDILDFAKEVLDSD